MPLHRPRRIFRSGSINSARIRSGVSPALLAGLFGAVIGAGLMLTSMPSALFGRVPVLAGVVNADAPLVAVVDGGTLRLRDTVIRLDGVAAPTRGQSCRSAAAGVFDCGTAATQALAALVRGHPVSCRLAGRDAAGFPQGRCETGGRDLNRDLVASGWARARGDGVDFAPAEQEARLAHRGLWRNAGEAPAF